MAATYHVYVGNFGMNMNPNFNVMYLVNNNLNLQRRNMEPYDHAILAFIIPVLLTLVQIRYPADQDLFQAHPTAMKVLLSCLLAYCLAFGLWVLIMRHGRTRRGRQSHTYASFWCRMAMKVFGSVSVTSIVSILFPQEPYWQPLLYILCVAELLLLLGFFRKLVRTTCPILPLTVMDLSRSERTVNSGPHYVIPVTERFLARD